MDFTKPNLTGFTVYSKSGCSNCITAKINIKEKYFLFQEINCDKYILDF